MVGFSWTYSSDFDIVFWRLRTLCSCLSPPTSFAFTVWFVDTHREYCSRFVIFQWIFQMTAIANISIPITQSVCVRLLFSVVVMFFTTLCVAFLLCLYAPSAIQIMIMFRYLGAHKFFRMNFGPTACADINEPAKIVSQNEICQIYTRLYCTGYWLLAWIHLLPGLTISINKLLLLWSVISTCIMVRSVANIY